SRRGRRRARPVHERWGRRSARVGRSRPRARERLGLRARRSPLLPCPGAGGLRRPPPALSAPAAAARARAVSGARPGAGAPPLSPRSHAPAGARRLRPRARHLALVALARAAGGLRAAVRGPVSRRRAPRERTAAAHGAPRSRLCLLTA